MDDEILTETIDTETQNRWFQLNFLRSNFENDNNKSMTLFLYAVMHNNMSEVKLISWKQIRNKWQIFYELFSAKINLNYLNKKILNSFNNFRTFGLSQGIYLADHLCCDVDSRFEISNEGKILRICQECGSAYYSKTRHKCKKICQKVKSIEMDPLISGLNEYEKEALAVIKNTIKFTKKFGRNHSIVSPLQFLLITIITVLRKCRIFLM